MCKPVSYICIGLHVSNMYKMLLFKPVFILIESSFNIFIKVNLNSFQFVLYYYKIVCLYIVQIIICTTIQVILYKLIKNISSIIMITTMGILIITFDVA